jgi:hypothetical protein
MDLAVVRTAESGQHKQDEGYEAHVADDEVELGGEVSLLQVKVSVILRALHLISAFYTRKWTLRSRALAPHGAGNG